MMMGHLDFVEAKKFEDSPPREVNINVNVKEIVLNKDIFKVSFAYDIQYTPNIGYIRLQGHLDLKASPNDIAFFQKTQKLPDKVMQNVTNIVLQNCTVQTVIISNVIKLPPPINMPSVQVKKTIQKTNDGDVSYIG